MFHIPSINQMQKMYEGPTYTL